MEECHCEIIPERILGLQRLEDLFNLKGYLICQSTGDKIYDFDQVVAVFIPISPTMEQVMAVHTDHARDFLQRNLSFLFP
ncbi:hypothetical protein Desaci_2998 [Desulfosporosinus acidiphilus SJ4]|uniref:Uncharacterized protein n=1 Tax=Desulfosporosinus acidiphilus (strain DSM 22704 / JCM 16185 / SJ4) TaxID=646529 RepID=I4D7Y3_DESAJ|nr:hypothetical protein [Desulfosporosinus acidiphilus]AFM41907.1 hypothetical protein Desaci_2998 [Desulfosporosinus acidiphilus SJ4]